MLRTNLHGAVIGKRLFFVEFHIGLRKRLEFSMFNAGGKATAQLQTMDELNCRDNYIVRAKRHQPSEPSAKYYDPPVIKAVPV